MPDIMRTHTIVEGLRALHFPSDRDGEMTAYLDRLFERDAEGTPIPVPLRLGRTRETRAILYVADPGDGKTHSVQRGLFQVSRARGAAGWLAAQDFRDRAKPCFPEFDGLRVAQGFQITDQDIPSFDLGTRRYPA